MEHYRDEHGLALAYGEMRELIDGAGFTESGWTNVVDRLRSLFPGSIWWMMNQDSTDRRCDFVVTSGISDSLQSVFYQHYASINPWASDWQRRRNGETAISERDDPIWLKKNSEYYTDFLEKFDDPADAASGMKLGSSNSVYSFMGMHYDRRREDNYGLPSERLMSMLFGSFSRAVEMNRMLVETVTQSTSAAALVQRGGDRAVVIRRDFSIVDANLPAQEEFRRQSVMSDPGLNLKFMRAETQQWARLQISSHAAGRPALRLERLEQSEAGRNRIKITPLPGQRFGAMAPFFNAPDLYLIQVTPLDTHDFGSEFGAAFPEYFGLTPAEGRFCALLATGMDLDECGKVLGVSRETVRSRLKSVFQKTGARRQAELVALLVRMKL